MDPLTTTQKGMRAASNQIMMDKRQPQMVQKSALNSEKFSKIMQEIKNRRRQKLISHPQIKDAIVRQLKAGSNQINIGKQLALGQQTLKILQQQREMLEICEAISNAQIADAAIKQRQRPLKSKL